MWDEDLFWEIHDLEMDLMWERIFGPDEPTWQDHVPVAPTGESPALEVG